MVEKLKHCPFCDCWLPGAGGDGSRAHPQSKCILSNWIITPHDAKVWNARPIEDRLTAELTAERERRVAAEKIIQYAEEHMSPSFMACEADAYRKRFNVVSWPKGDDHG